MGIRRKSRNGARGWAGRILAAGLLCLASASGLAADWAHKQKITLDATAAAGNLAQGATSVPIAVRLHSGNFTFADAKPDGTDIRFMSADGKLPLKFHVEQFDAANELGVAWVMVPKITANAKTDSFVMEWGNPGAPPAADAKGTYDASQIFVLHFSDKEGVRDASGNANNAQAVLDLLLAQVREQGSACLLVTHSEKAAARADRCLLMTEAGLIEPA